MSGELVQVNIKDQIEYAKLVTDGSTILPDEYRGRPANALIAIGLGQAMGLSPAESMYRIHVIKGKPTAAAELIAANVRKAGHKIRVTTDEAKVSATCTIIRSDDPEFPWVVTRDMGWAKQMGLASKDNYKSQPLTMLQWRAISACARLACSEALYGVTYTPDEMTDLGEFKSAQPASEPAAATPTLSDLKQAEEHDWLAMAEEVRGDFETIKAIYFDARNNHAPVDVLEKIKAMGDEAQAVATATAPDPSDEVVDSNAEYA